MAIMGQRSVEIVLTLEVTVPGRPPYQTQVTQFIPDIRLASVQPGGQVHVRVDPMNPNVLAIADSVQGGVGAAPVIASGGAGGWGAAPGVGNAPVIQPTAQAGGGGAGWGAPPAGAPGGWGAPPAGAQMGGPMMPAAGLVAPDMGKAMKRSMTMTLVILFITTVPIAVIMAAVFVDWSAFGIDFGGDGDGDGAPKGGYCEGTVRCCKVVYGNSATANCDNWKNLPAAGCKSTWETYSQTAKSQGKTCK